MNLGLPAWRVTDDVIDELAALLRSKRVAVLTGAGCSTESGIPDYRGPETRRRARNPMEHNAFVGDAMARRRYWARAVLGWDRFAHKAPNRAHQALAELERGRIVSTLITQNVDRLHQAAGSREVIELHGALADVRCLECEATEPRAELQRRLHELNPGWRHREADPAPDGDAEPRKEDIDGFRVADCVVCGGPLKPDVVFFGDSVPRERVARAESAVAAADVLLVVGSSLAVFSGFRFVRQASRNGQPIAIVNLGESRGDPLATLRVHGLAGDVLPRLAEKLRGKANVHVPHLGAAVRRTADRLD